MARKKVSKVDNLDILEIVAFYTFIVVYLSQIIMLNTNISKIKRIICFDKRDGVCWVDKRWGGEGPHVTYFS